MTKEQEAMLNRINQYAEQVMADIDPQKTQISIQLEKLKPIMETIASEQGRPLEEIFIEFTACSFPRLLLLQATLL